MRPEPERGPPHPAHPASPRLIPPHPPRPPHPPHPPRPPRPAPAPSSLPLPAARRSKMHLQFLQGIIGFDDDDEEEEELGEDDEEEGEEEEEEEVSPRPPMPLPPARMQSTRARSRTPPPPLLAVPTASLAPCPYPPHVLPRRAARRTSGGSTSWSGVRHDAWRRGGVSGVRWRRAWRGQVGVLGARVKSPVYGLWSHSCRPTATHARLFTPLWATRTFAARESVI